MTTQQCRIIVLISGSGTNLQALIDAAHSGIISGEIVAVISNRPKAGGLQRAKDAHIQTIITDHTTFPSRESFDIELQQQIESCKPDLIVLAGFMRILPTALVERYQGRMLNIHPSLLPKYRGLHTHQRALESGDKEHGASVHFVTAELDGGPIILQSKLTIRSDHTATSLANELLPLEHEIYPKAVGWFCDKKLHHDGKHIVFSGEVLTEPLLIENIR